MTSYDAIVIGTGQAGPYVTSRLAGAGMKDRRLPAVYSQRRYVDAGGLMSYRFWWSAKSANVCFSSARRAANGS